MTATIMQALDTTIANVALPYMQGSLSASLDQINWVLTSYIVAAAIMTAPIGWIADRFGRKKLFIICVAGFTVASLLCAMAQNIVQIVLFRLMQGMAGAALVPLSQSVLLDAYPPERRGGAMAIWGMGVMLGPIMGPTLGGWLTDNYSWHWVFLINLPIGVGTVIGMMLFMEETEQHHHLRFDWFGFIALAGVAAEFGVVMLLYLHHAWEHQLALDPHADQEALDAAIREGAVQRVRPKAMTVAVILAGLFPILLGHGAGSEVMQRIAAPMIGGMVTAPLLSMLVIPAAYRLLHGRALTRRRSSTPSSHVITGEHQ